jgi:hypothetical protein
MHSRDILHKTNGDHLDWVHSDQMVRVDQVRWSFLPEAESLKTSSKKTIRLESTYCRSGGSRDSQAGGCPCEWRPTQGLYPLRMLKSDFENNSRQPNNSKTAGKREPKKKSLLTLSLVGLLWRGSWSQWKDDDEWEPINQSNCPQVHVTVILGTD